MTQYSVGLDNKPGSLARFCGALRKEKVNIEAICVLDIAEAGWVRIVASPSAATRSALTRGGFAFTTQRVIAVEAQNRPGELERLAGALHKAGVGINYVYGSVADEGEPVLIFGVSDVDHAAKVLERL